MRKTIKAILLSALILLLFIVTALIVSASPSAPTGSTTRSAEHMFSIQNGSETYYYTDLEAAVTDVPAGGTVVLLRNATAGGTYVEGDHPTSSSVEDGYILALSLSRDATYAIDGNGYTLTLTPGYSKPSYDNANGAKANPETSVAVHISAGIVTFKNLSLTLSSASQADVAFYIQNPKRSLDSVHVTLENVSFHFAHKYGLWAHQHANVTVTGGKTSISGSTINALRIQGGAGASTFTLAGGTVSGGASGIEIKGTGAKFNLTGGVLSAPTPITVTAKSTFNMTGGTIKIGSDSLFNISSSVTFTTNLTGGTLIVQNENGVPAYDGIDTSALDLIWAPEYITLPPQKLGSIVISRKQTFSSLSDWTTIVDNSKPTIASDAFKSVTYAPLVPILIPSGYTLTITAGDYTTPIDSMETLFYVQGGNLTIKGGTFKNTNPNGAIISVYEETSASVIKVSNSLFYATKSFLSIPHTSRVSSATLSNITIIMNEHAEKLFDASTFALDTVTHTNLTVLSKVACHLFNQTYIDETSPRMLFAGEYYGSYMESAATNATIDVSNANDALNGASLYIAPTADYSGIRFVTELSSDVITAIKALGGSPIFGTVIAPLDYVLKAGAFTIDALSTLSVTGAKYEKIPASKSIRDNDGDGIPESFSAALINLKAKNYTRIFAAISYMELDGIMYYGSFNAEKNALSINEIAKQCLQISDYFSDTEVELLKSYAGFVKPDDCKLTLTWTRGTINSELHTSKPLQIATSLNHIYSDVIHIEKAGTAITFSDPNTAIANQTVLVISHWTPSGDDYVLDTTAKNHNGASTEIALTAYGQTHYTYVSSSDNEYIRICVRQALASPVTVYSQLTGENGTDTVVPSAAKPPIEEFTIGGVNALKYQIVLKDNYTMKEWYAALHVKNLIANETGISIPLNYESDATAAPRIEIGMTNDLLTNEHTYISKVENGKWILSANSLFAYNSLQLYLDNTLFKPNSSTLALDNTHEYIGDGTVAATELITPSGDVRMIFNNLWGNADSQSALRAKMFVELYEAYSPDIICLQECSPGLRDMGIVSGLAALGYDEVPSDSTNTYYGSENVTRNPIFYNAEKFTLLDYGFSQFATMDFGKYPELMGGYTASELYNTAKDDGSKSVTWGIFLNHETDDVFLVGSTHLWYKGDAIDDVVRTIQMRELREVLTAAAAAYMSESALESIPIFCGGDYNSRTSRDSYHSMSEGETPFTNLNDLVTDAAHKLVKSSTHSYPTWHKGFGIWSNVDSNANSYGNAIDHIFCSKETADMITVNHMGMPFEKHFAFMSDHSAIFADVTFK